MRIIKVSRKTDRVVRAGACSLGSFLAGLALTAAGTEGKVEILSRERGNTSFFEPAYVYEVLLEAVTARVLDFYIQVQLSGTSGRKWRARSNHTTDFKKSRAGRLATA